MCEGTTQPAPERPRRIQRKRTKGWRMPEGAVSVSRPGAWGNPFIVGEPYRLRGYFPDRGYELTDTGVVQSRAHAVVLFRSLMVAKPALHPEIRRYLGGHDLACWCPLYEPCHADVLLELANAEAVS